MAEEEAQAAAQTQNGDELEQFLDDVQKAKNVPENEFEHAEGLVRSEYDDDNAALKNFSMIVDKHLQLTNIGNDEIMRFYQTDAVLLTQAFSIAHRSEAFKSVVKMIFYGWRNELLLTKAKNGEERKHQAGVGKAKYAPKESLLGYGSSYDLNPQEEQNLLAGLFKPRSGNNQGRF